MYCVEGVQENKMPRAENDNVICGRLCCYSAYNICTNA